MKNAREPLRAAPDIFGQGMAMEIITERLVLRPTDESYFETTHEYAADAENTRYMMFLPYMSEDETRSALRQAAAQWKLAEPEYREYVMLRDGEHIGGITLYFLNDRSEGELGWVLNRKYWGMGYAAEAARALLERARDEWGMRRVIACCDSENHASRRVMEKLGMRHADTGPRKNRSSDEERIELIYEIIL